MKTISLSSHSSESLTTQSHTTISSRLFKLNKLNIFYAAYIVKELLKIVWCIIWSSQRKSPIHKSQLFSTLSKEWNIFGIVKMMRCSLVRRWNIIQYFCSSRTNRNTSAANKQIQQFSEPTTTNFVTVGEGNKLSLLECFSQLADALYLSFSLCLVIYYLFESSWSPEFYHIIFSFSSQFNVIFVPL